MSERARREPERDDDASRVVGTDVDAADTARSSLAGFTRYGGLGIQYAGTIVVLGALGYWADSAFDTLPWFLIAGILIGSVGGFISLVKKVPGPRKRRAAHMPSDSGKPPHPR